MATPYRAHGELGDILPDPSRPRLALAFVGFGGVTSFVALVVYHFVPWNHALATALALGGATIILGLAIAGFTSRTATAMVAAVTLALAYVSTGVWLAVLGRPLPAAATWPIRYASIAVGAVALLVLYRRLQQRSYGLPLRLAAVIGAHWAIVRAVSLWVPDAAEVNTVELVARFAWLFLGVGAWQLRRWIGVSVPRAPAATDLGAVVSTRLAVACATFALRLALLDDLQAPVAVLTASLAADAIGATVAFAVEVPAFHRVAPERTKVALVLALLTIVPGLVLVVDPTAGAHLLPFLQLAPVFALVGTVRKHDPQRVPAAFGALVLHVASAILSLFAAFG